MTILLALLILLNLATLVVGWRLYRRAERFERASRAAEEGRERARWMREIETKERWATLELDGMHPINREEANRLLHRIEGASTRVLTRGERDFLDRMVEAQQRRASGGAPNGTPAAAPRRPLAPGT